MTLSMSQPHVVYPANGHKTADISTFVMGSVPSGQRCQIEINGEVIDEASLLVASGGSFTATIPLTPGSNIIELSTMAHGVKTSEPTTLVVHRKSPLHHDANEPPRLVLDTLMPSEPVVMMRGDWLHVGGWVGRSDVSVSVSIPGLVDDPVRLEPMTGDGFVDTRQGIFAQLHQVERPIPKAGYFTGAINLPWMKNEPDGPIPLVFHFDQIGRPSDDAVQKSSNVVRFAPGNQPLNGNSHSQMVPNYLQVWTQPRHTVVNTDQAVVRTAPVDGARLTPLPKDTPLAIRESQGDWLCAAIAAHQKLWIHRDHCEPLTVMKYPRRPQSVRAIRIDGLEADRRAKCRLLGVTPTPIQIRTLANSDNQTQLTLDVFGVTSYCDFIHWEPGTHWITNSQWQQVQDNQMRLTLSIPNLAGYDYGFDDDGFWLSVKRLPKTPHDTIILLDPGHGGHETGSVGPTGVAEKAINLSVATKLATLLKQAGFHHTHLTRESDVDVSLDVRSDLAASLDADVVLSIHHNALPDGRDPLTTRGTSSYFYHGFAKPFADTLQHTLVSQLDLPDYGILYDSLHMARIHTGLATLVELGFMTHPTEYEELITDAFQSRAAQGLFNGIETLFKLKVQKGRKVLLYVSSEGVVSPEMTL